MAGDSERPQASATQSRVPRGPGPAPSGLRFRLSTVLAVVAGFAMFFALLRAGFGEALLLLAGFLSPFSFGVVGALIERAFGKGRGYRGGILGGVFGCDLLFAFLWVDLLRKGYVSSSSLVSWSVWLFPTLFGFFLGLYMGAAVSHMLDPDDAAGMPGTRVPPEPQDA